MIVPVYNVEQYLERCLDSLLNQTEKDIEIIVVNDGTRDNSQKIIDSYVKKYPNKMISLIKENGGLSDARNYGMPYAKGEYIAFLDSDDYVEYDMYERMLEASSNGEKLIVACGYRMEWADHSITVLDEIPDNIEDYLLSGLVVAWNKLYKREWLLKSGIIFPKGLLYEDTEFFCKLMLFISDVSEIGIVRETFVHYIQRINSISYSEASRIDDIHTICDHVVDFYKVNNASLKYNNAVEYKFVKTLLGNFFLKYLHISDKTKKQYGIDNNWEYIIKTFPNWKKNIFISQKGGNAIKIYLRIMNKTIYKILAYFPVMFLEKIVRK